MSKQISEYFQPFFSKFQWGLQKILAPSSVFCQCLRSGNRELDLFKAIGCLSRDLFIAKLNAYGFSIDSLRLVEDYLSNRKQRTWINSTYSSWEETIFGVPQGYILGPLLFICFLCDLFFIMNVVDFISYTDNNTPYIIANDIEDVIFRL